MKRTAVFAFVLCILLYGCTAKPTEEMLPTGEANPPYTSTDTKDSLEVSADEETVAWPTAEEIRATIDAGQVEVYWLADVTPITGADDLLQRYCAGSGGILGYAR